MRSSTCSCRSARSRSVRVLNNCALVRPTLAVPAIIPALSRSSRRLLPKPHNSRNPEVRLFRAWRTRPHEISDEGLVRHLLAVAPLGDRSPAATTHGSNVLQRGSRLVDQPSEMIDDAVDRRVVTFEWRSALFTWTKPQQIANLFGSRSSRRTPSSRATRSALWGSAMWPPAPFDPGVPHSGSPPSLAGLGSGFDHVEAEVGGAVGLAGGFGSADPEM